MLSLPLHTSVVFTTLGLRLEYWKAELPDRNYQRPFLEHEPPVCYSSASGDRIEGAWKSVQ